MNMLNTQEIKHIRDLILADLLNGNDVNINGIILRKLDEQLTLPDASTFDFETNFITCDCKEPMLRPRNLSDGGYDWCKTCNCPLGAN